MAVGLHPEAWEPLADLRQKMAGQMPHAYPGQDQEPGVVRQQREVALAHLRLPADEGIPALRLPGRRAEEHTGQQMALRVTHHDLEVLAHTGAMTQVVITIEQELEQGQARISPAEHIDSQGLQRPQLALNRASIVIYLGDLPIASLVGPTGLAGRELDLAHALELEKKRTAGHVLQASLGIAPAPSLA